MSRSIAALASFTAFYMLASVASAFATGNSEFVFYIAVMLVLIGCVAYVRTRVALPLALLWMLSVWGLLHMAGGLVPVPQSWPIDGEIRVLYSWWIVPSAPGGGLFETGGWLKYDQLVHAYGFGTTTWLCWCALRGSLSTQTPTPGLMVLSAGAGMGFGALNEVVEFLATRFTETNVGGYVNTGLDLVFNLLGCVSASTVILLADRLSSRRGR